MLRRLDLEVFEEGRPTVLVDRSGKVYLWPLGEAPHEAATRQWSLFDATIDLIAPFSSLEGAKGPDLSSPREHVRIVPRKLSGAPHIVDTRVETSALFALHVRGFPEDRIASLFPSLEMRAIKEGLALEEQLAGNLLSRRAA